MPPWRSRRRGSASCGARWRRLPSRPVYGLCISGVSLAACLDAANLRFKSASSTYNTTAPSAGSRRIYDSVRKAHNPTGNVIWANLSSAETADASYEVGMVAFKIRNTSSDFNANGYTYIYVAFAEQPFRYANAR